jgi:2-keto-4-pentenoate hydratase
MFSGTLVGMTNGAREAQIMKAANLLLNARREGQPIADLPSDLQPTSIEEAYQVQDFVAVAYGGIGGWKVGAPSANAVPLFAPMPSIWIAPSGTQLRGIRYKGLEAEIAFLLGRDLPRRETPYTRKEIVDAIASCHPAIEVLESGLIDPAAATRFSMIGDLQMHGGFVYGPACPDWQTVDFLKESVTLAIDGAVRVERTGSNTAGDLMRLLPFLANEAATRTNGLKAGQWITTGSWTGNTLATAGASVDVQFSTLGRVSLSFTR